MAALSVYFGQIQERALAVIIRPPVIWDIHADESCQNVYRYIVIGALWGRADYSAKVTAAIEEAIRPYGGTSELKWTKVKKHNVRMYQAAIKAVSSLVKSGAVRFNCIVIDSHKSNHREYNEGDPELGFTKYTFTLLYKFARTHYKPEHQPHYYVHLDQRGTRYSPEVTRITLNRRDATEHGRTYEAYKQVHFIDSKESRLIQMADVFTGIIAAAWNGEHSAAHKHAMIEFARIGWNLPALNQDTGKYRGRQGIDIWFLDWTAKKKAAP